MNVKLFDEWASSYNTSIKESEEAKTYPFYGYGEIQEFIYQNVSKRSNTKILEMGIGTGLMTKKLYEDGYDITGVDFSSEMIKEAKKIMPFNTYIECDFISALKKISNSKFDVIIFSYSIHHLKPINQKYLLDALYKNLNKDGLVIIGDVITNTDNEMIEQSEKYSNIWDYDEYYPTLSKYKSTVLMQNYTIEFIKVSNCSGIITLRK